MLNVWHCCHRCRAMTAVQSLPSPGKPKRLQWRSDFLRKANDYPFVGAQNYDTIALKRINASTFTSEIKKADKVVLTVKNTVSPDGKTITLHCEGTNAQGQPPPR